MQRKTNEKRKNRRVASITIVSIALTFCFLANNGSKLFQPNNTENINAERENYFEFLQKVFSLLNTKSDPDSKDG
jgi:hypothetical protein